MRFVIETPDIEADTVAEAMAIVVVELARGGPETLLRYQWYLEGRPITVNRDA